MTKQIFYFEAEHISRCQGVALVKKLEDAGVEVECAGMSDVLSDTFRMTATSTQAEAEKIRAAIWAANNGAYCDMQVTNSIELN